MSIITKTDFTSDLVQFTQNIEDRIINPHIGDAEEYDLRPLLDPDLWAKIIGTPGAELTTFIATYLKPYLVYAAYARFLLWQGRNIVQYGIDIPTDDTSTPISDKGRGELIKDIRAKVDIRLGRMYKELDEVSYTFDSIIYDNTCQARKTPINIRQI